MEIQALIIQKRAMLDLARKKVSELEAQIQALSSMNNEDEFDVMLASKIKSAQVMQGTPALDFSDARQTASVSPLLVTLKGRNPKGSIKAILREIFSDDQEHDLDEIEKRLNEKAPKNVHRSAIRSTLMYMKEDEEISSRKAGVFQRAQKGETPVTAGVSSASESKDS